ncbi:MAG: cobalt-precorrin 5A hydrolase [Lachnospiraceae bacterium]|nr:cobalt-precorrin 5A hydrolase [Lachnospiraceae bacterium]MCI9547015.1 cobalt-precorrin 5A hydrolase [Lachnospiraceae bacterium]
MKAGIISFSRRGFELGETLKEGLKRQGWQVEVYGKSRYMGEGSQAGQVKESVGQWTGENFSRMDALIYVGACGIAVRSIAPYIRHKTTDPAVVVVDERGRFSISLLSGHIGGGNDLAQTAAEIIGAQPVVTTATDLNGLFAVDVFAKKNGCHIADMKLAKEVSAQLLAGKQVGFYSDFPWKGELPRGLTVEGRPDLGIAVTIHCKERPFSNTLYLIPKALTVGIGCRKGTPSQAVEAAVESAADCLQIPMAAIERAASIDLKKDEAGIVESCRKWNVPFETFSAEELQALAGTYTPSPFVKSIAGVDNVCERSAVLASGNGKLILRKTVRDGVTVALAMRAWTPSF